MTTAPGSSLPGAWRDLRRLTPARLALGRTGGSVATADLLDFRLAHARARDAVHAPFDAAALAADLQAGGVATVTLASAAPDRATYLRRPDLGRRLSEAARGRLTELPPADFDIALIVSDGLSALAAARQAAPTVLALHAHLQALGWRVAPILIVPLARVKLQDEIGAVLAVRHTVLLLGERPGLGAPDSLGAYLTHRPHAGCTDADRNCVSNIRPAGLTPVAAAAKLAQLLAASVHLGCSGVRLKDIDLPPLPPPTGSIALPPSNA